LPLCGRVDDESTQLLKAAKSITSPGQIRRGADAICHGQMMLALYVNSAIFLALRLEKAVYPGAPAIPPALLFAQVLRSISHSWV
jgi:hypothetical protein